MQAAVAVHDTDQVHQRVVEVVDKVAVAQVNQRQEPAQVPPVQQIQVAAQEVVGRAVRIVELTEALV
jgi:hypothetical protein